jgi:hypothetical protein
MVSLLKTTRGQHAASFWLWFWLVQSSSITQPIVSSHAAMPTAWRSTCFSPFSTARHNITQHSTPHFFCSSFPASQRPRFSLVFIVFVYLYTEFRDLFAYLRFLLISEQLWLPALPLLRLPSVFSTPNKVCLPSLPCHFLYHPSSASSLTTACPWRLSDSILSLVIIPLPPISSLCFLYFELFALVSHSFLSFHLSFNPCFPFRSRTIPRSPIAEVRAVLFI